MLQIITPDIQEQYDEKNNEFFTIRSQTFNLEHSLISISKWESKWEKPFLDDSYEKTTDEILDYIRCMIVPTKGLDMRAINYLSEKNVEDISNYINAKMTATWFSKQKTSKSGAGEKVTSELIYYWMTAFNIPFECEKWHINRLLTLIRICELKNQPSKKMDKKAIYDQNRALNAARRARSRSKG